MCFSNNYACSLSGLCLLLIIIGCVQIISILYLRYYYFFQFGNRNRFLERSPLRINLVDNKVLFKKPSCYRDYHVLSMPADIIKFGRGIEIMDKGFTAFVRENLLHTSYNEYLCRFQRLYIICRLTSQRR